MILAKFKTIQFHALLLVFGLFALGKLNLSLGNTLDAEVADSTFCNSFEKGTKFDPAATEQLMRKKGYMSAGVRLDSTLNRNESSNSKETLGMMDPKSLREVNMVTKSGEHRRSVKLDMKSGIITKVTCSQEDAHEQYGHLRSDGTVD